MFSHCIEFEGYRDAKGYGTLKRSGRLWRAHRWAWVHANGPIPDGLFVCHSCDNPACINIDHLFLGTAADNSRDMREKGRSIVGERNPKARLTWDDVRYIRSQVADGVKQKRLAEKFETSRGTISMIVNNKRWKED